MFGLSYLKPRTEGKAPAAWGIGRLVGRKSTANDTHLRAEVYQNTKIDPALQTSNHAGHRAYTIA
jgi:hypothetical protein